MLSLSLVRNRISPIQMNSGSAVSVQLEAEPQTVTAIASPAGRDENSCMPIQATPASVRPIQTPLPSSANSATISRVVMATSFIVQEPPRAARGGAAAAQFEHPLVDEGDQQHHRARPPSPICGIHSGVASLPVEMSLKTCDCQARRTE